MASVVNRPNGHKWIQFRGLAGRRQTIRLGKVPLRQAKEFRRRVEYLLVAGMMGQPPDVETVRWVATLPPKLHARLAAVDLVEGRQVATLADLIAEFKSSLTIAPSTRANITQACGNLGSYFGQSQLISTVTPADAAKFFAWLASDGGAKGGSLSPATVSRRYRRARQVFAFAVKKRWLAENPFAGRGAAKEINREKDFVVTPDLIARVLHEATNAEFRAIIVLARFGGLRCPSEVLPLQWTRINWDHQTLTVEGVKTGAQRIVPLFPEVRLYLEDLWETVGPGQSLVFPQHQITGAGLSSELQRACRAASIVLWRKPWQNMRATRENELLEEFPLHVVTAWMGHSPKVAIEHYARISKEHYARAVKFGKSVLCLPGRPEKRSKTRRSTG